MIKMVVGLQRNAHVNVDLAAIKQADLSPITPIIVTNSAAYAMITPENELKNINTNEPILQIN